MRLRAVVPLSVLLAASVAGCGRDAEERQLDEMNETIREVQADRDEVDHRLLAEVAGGEGGHLQAPSRAGSPGTPAPPPPAVSLSAGAGEDPVEQESPDTEDPSPRPTIRILGSPRARGAADQVEQSGMAADDGAQPPRSSALDPEAKHAYDAALSLVSARQYDRALDALAAFLVKWPDHPYADNAMYWRGECYFAKGDYLRASEQFEGVVNRFPAGNKAADALLKLGISQQKLGNPAKAKEAFDRLAQQYPQSEAARRIPPVTMPATTPRSEDHR